jgi:outer membrane murein-binding lipoprotein Lpp
MMQEYLSHFEFLVVASTLVGGWLKFQADYNKLSSRVHTLEADNKEFKDDVKQLLKDIQEIKLLLAKNKVE